MGLEVPDRGGVWLAQRAWGQDHIAKVLLGIEAGQHDAVGDACKSMKLWHLYQALQAEPEKHKKMLVSRDLQLRPLPRSKKLQCTAVMGISCPIVGMRCHMIPSRFSNTPPKEPRSII